MAEANLDAKMALNSEILAQGHPDEVLARDVTADGPRTSYPQAYDNNNKLGSGARGSIVKAHAPQSIANKSATEWNVGGSTGPGGTFQEHWPSHLPRPPSRKNLMADGQDAPVNTNIPQVIVFNANTREGGSMVRVLSDKGLRVVAVVRVFTSRNAKALIKLKNVTVKVADLNNIDAVIQAATGCSQAFLVTKYWERFESQIEENMAKVVLDACSQCQVKRLVLATFEDTHELRLRGTKSQLKPTADGRIFPEFKGMNSIQAMAKQVGVEITHMMTSYFDDTDSKKSLILLRGSDGKIVSQPYIQETPQAQQKLQQQHQKA